MKFSEQWLRQWIDPELDSEQLVVQLTMAGLEVDGVEPVAGVFKGVCVAEVLEVQAHPDADKLSVCQVNTGQAQYQVVCGASNVRAGIKVALAEVGAVLPGNFKIKKAKLRGVASEGMLCSEKELELSDNHDGIMELSEGAPVGEDIRRYLELDDQCIEIDLTPNRGDCLSIKGLAREVGVLNRMPVLEVTVEPVAPRVDDTFKVTVEAPEGCPRYLGRVLRNINPDTQSPLWLQEQLRRSGMRSIDPVVDVTNYVMMELGQPMHAFDLAKLNGSINVRMAKAGESLVLLDGQEVQLTEQTLLITDQSGPIAMAGIMGGAATGVTNQTKDIFLESAFFTPLTIAGKARSYGLHTDSSHRYERGVDFQLQRTAIERATQLLLDIVGGEPGPVVEQCSEENLPRASAVQLRGRRVAQILSIELETKEIVDILNRLGMQVETQNEEEWQVATPSYRFDISIEADLIEEIARVYGYNQLPAKMPQISQKRQSKSESEISLQQLRRVLLTRGYYEAITYSFVDPKLQSYFLQGKNAISLANPISSDMSDMRTSLWPGLVQALQYNQNRQHSRVRLFESGLVFSQTESGVQQLEKLGGIIAGMRDTESWAHASNKVDFFDIKGDLEALLMQGGQFASYQFVSIDRQQGALHPGQSAEIISGGRSIGMVGAMHPSVERALNLNGPVFLFEVEVAAIQCAKIANFEELSKFPEVRRDLAIIVDESVHLSQVNKVIREQAGEYLTDLKLFDLYQGKGIGPGRKSFALGLTWQHRSRTLTDEEISQLVSSIIKNLEKEFNAVLRG